MASRLIVNAPDCRDLDDLANEAERIADMIRNGFFSGEVEGGGWWHIETAEALMPAAAFTAEELATIGEAVQWAGHFALCMECQSGGPSFATIAAATALIEAQGVTIHHTRAVREAIA